MIRFYFHPTPNPAKIALFLEEAGIAYEAIPVETTRSSICQPGGGLIVRHACCLSKAIPLLPSQI
jgi:hypothetical protein